MNRLDGQESRTSQNQLIRMLGQIKRWFKSTFQAQTEWGKKVKVSKQS